VGNEGGETVEFCISPALIFVQRLACHTISAFAELLVYVCHVL